MDNRTLSKAIKILKRHLKKFRLPVVSRVSRRRNPFKVLISCLLSLRTKDEVTGKASERLFHLASSPEEMGKLSIPLLQKTIYPVGFYKTKSRTIKNICRVLLEKYEGNVPDSLEELLKLKGVGRKTANLVITEAFRKPGICVDTHVNRITNRWGYVRTKNPHETEFALRKKLPGRYWLKINELLVIFGQNICVPISPKCSICPLNRLCPKIGVTRHR